MMNKSASAVALGLSAFLVAGCALPVPLQIASWALDGISYVITEKSVTDHGLSVVAQKDCAVWRGVTKGEFCRNWHAGDGVLVADADAPIRAESPPTQRAVGQSGPITLVSTRIGFWSAPGNKLEARAVSPRRAPAKPAKTTAAKKSTNAKVRTAVQPLALTPATKARHARELEPATGVYFVIGSFRNYADAHQMTSRHDGLSPVVLAANLDGPPVYRVVIGPAQRGQEKVLHRDLADRGLRNIWAIRVMPGDWTLAQAVIARKKSVGIGAELTDLRR